VSKKKQEKPKQLVAEASVLSDLISYQEGSVVSRTIIDRDAGTVTLFAFDEAQGLSEHTAPFDAMVYIVEGEAEVKISDKPVKLKQGELTIMPANKTHALTALTRFKMLLIMIKA
jgi:quercetin dioxygenase-like cupin family protein